jgi:SsrA-binding protein|tara:strand:- start:7893 stop:8339 length:447 start_codon:yes stop_codon:yes gene_type:complete
MKTILNNRKASFNYDLIKHYTAGIMLVGSEVKSLRQGKGNIGDAYCYFKNDGLWLKSLYIPEYKPAGNNNHEPYRDRKLLMKKQELASLKGKMEQKGMSIVPVKVVFNDSHKIKVEVSLGKGKRVHDKRDSIKAKDQKKDLDRDLKNI